jgi:hypothetical protein
MADLKLIHQEPDAESVKKESVKKVILKDTEKNNDSKEEVDLEVTGNLTVKGSINPNDPWYQVIPKYTIVMWYGSDKEVPKGWAICDGENNTPDLRGRFVMGADHDADFSNYKTKQSELTIAKDAYKSTLKDYNKYVDEFNDVHTDKHWDTLNDDEKNAINSTQAQKILAEKQTLDSSELFLKSKQTDFTKITNEFIKKGILGGSDSQVKNKLISGSGLDMSKAEYVSEVDYPPYMALYYIMKL